MRHFFEGRHELAHVPYDPWADADEEPESFWASGPDEETVERVERLLRRIPPRWAVHARMSLEGLSTVEAARRVGLAQPTAHAHRRKALGLLAWAGRNLPDMTAEEVEAVLLKAKGIRAKEAQIASAYWQGWETTRCGTPQGTAFGILFGTRPYTRGIAFILARRDGVEGEVGRGLLAIRARPRVTRERDRRR